MCVFFFVFFFFLTCTKETKTRVIKINVMGKASATHQLSAIIGYPLTCKECLWRTAGYSNQSEDGHVEEI